MQHTPSTRHVRLHRELLGRSKICSSDNTACTCIYKRREDLDSKMELTSRRNATWWWYRRRNRLALAPNAVCPAPSATVLPEASPPASARLRFPAALTPMPSRVLPPRPLLPRQSTLLLGFVGDLAADPRFLALTPATMAAGSS